jgi:dihydroneopterin aldolase/2-amino-4-hydroxy-6-hydroxymethyldihydropteridine diphosphokinase
MDTIKIIDLEVYAKHGVYKEENLLGQKFLVCAELGIDTRNAGLKDDLELSVDYGQICKFINQFMTETTYRLIEAVAENLALAILQRFHGVREIRLEIKKPWAPIGLPLDYVSVVIERKWHTAYIGVGSNLGNRQEYLDFAADEIDTDANCFLVKMADTIETEPYGMTEQPDFLNTCMQIRTLYTPQELLARCNEIEKRAGRERTVHWGPRTLDMDILFYDELVLCEENLVIPHVELYKRAFVLVPLAQIAPYKIHPVFKKSVLELLQDLLEKK